MKRRSIVAAMANTGLGLVALGLPAAGSFAQRAAHPINRPGRPGGPIGPGRLPGTSDGVARGALPGLFTVAGVNKQQSTVLLRDGDGRTADVHVAPELFDLSELSPGEEIEVDFVAPGGGSDRLTAGGIWKLTPAKQ